MTIRVNQTRKYHRKLEARDQKVRESSLYSNKQNCGGSSVCLHCERNNDTRHSSRVESGYTRGKSEPRRRFDVHRPQSSGGGKKRRGSSEKLTGQSFREISSSERIKQTASGERKCDVHLGGHSGFNAKWDESGSRAGDHGGTREVGAGCYFVFGQRDFLRLAEL